MAEPKFKVDKETVKIEINDVADKIKIHDGEADEIESGVDNESFELEDFGDIAEKAIYNERERCHEMNDTTSELGSISSGSNETVIAKELLGHKKGDTENEEAIHIEVVVQNEAHHDLEWVQKYSDFETIAPRKKLFYVDSKRLAKKEKLKYLTINGGGKKKCIERKWRRTSSLREVDDLEFSLDTTASPGMARSQYSLVSCSELTPGAVQLWLDLPEEVKYDSSLAVFRKLYEKEHGQVEDIPLKGKRSSGSRVARLPLVSSAPHLNNNASLTGNGQNGNPKINETEVKTVKIEESESKTAKAKHCIKMTVLIGVWIFFTVIFMMYNEKKETIRKSSVSPNEGKSFDIVNEDNQLSLKLDLVGPFLTEHEELALNSTQKESKKKIYFWLESWINPGLKSNELSKPSTILLQDHVDFVEGGKRTLLLHLRPSSTLETDETRAFNLRVNTTAASTVPFSISLTRNPLEINVGVMYACVLLVVLYGLIIFEIINRTLAAVVVATLSLAALALVGERPSLEEVVSWLDVETLLLLFSMMILVAIMAETGLFDFLAVFTFQVTKGSMWPLIILLCAITALLSTFLDNVTTVLLMTPVTIKLCEVTDLSPIPVLMAMVLYSNIGGTATPVGDPPNVIIASNKDVTNSGINFANFTLHMSIGIIFVCFQTYFQLRYLIYKNPNKLRLSAPREIEDLRKQISVWRRAHDALPHISKDESIVKERLARKVDKLSLKLDVLKKERRSRTVPKDTFETTLKELKLKYKIRDKILLIKALVAIGFVVAVFFLHALPEFHRVSLGWTALLGAILLLILADREELEPIMHRVEWSTLLFFAALFVLMEALSKLGLILYIGNLTESLIMSVNEGARLAVAMVLILWVSGVTSAFVDNIPLTTMMVRVVTSMGSNPTLNIPMAPLIWALSFGACLGGNGTLIGASANVVCAGVAEQHGYRFTFVEFFKVGFPVMIGHLIVASIYLLVCHSLFQWH